jgi:hypothetical protein
MSFAAAESETTGPPPVSPPRRWAWLVAPPEQQAIIADPARFATFATVLRAEAVPEPEDVRLTRLGRLAPELRSATLVSDLAPDAGTVLKARVRSDVLGLPADSLVAARTIDRTALRVRDVGLHDVAVRDVVLEADPVLVPERLVSVDIGVIEQAYDAITNESQPQEFESSSITLSFDYTLVTLDRQWFPEGLITNTNWYVPGYRAGQLLAPSSPTAQPAMPVAFVAVRRVHLAGTWSSRDVEALPSSVSLGPLSLVGRTITTSGSSVTVDSPGMQVVAWICQPLPTLPPEGDPGVSP